LLKFIGKAHTNHILLWPIWLTDIIYHAITAAPIKLKVDSDCKSTYMSIWRILCNISRNNEKISVIYFSKFLGLFALNRWRRQIHWAFYVTTTKFDNNIFRCQFFMLENRHYSVNIYLEAESISSIFVVEIFRFSKKEISKA